MPRADARVAEPRHPFDQELGRDGAAEALAERALEPATFVERALAKSAEKLRAPHHRNATLKPFSHVVGTRWRAREASGGSPPGSFCHADGSSAHSPLRGDAEGDRL